MSRKELRSDEVFVATALSRSYGTTFRKSDKDPPDIYLFIKEKEIAVEITRLTQYIRDGEGERPRTSDEMSVLRLIDELNHDLMIQTPPDGYFMIFMRGPVNKFRGTLRRLKAFLISVLNEPIPDRREWTETIEGNTIEIIYQRDPDRGSRGVIGGVIPSQTGYNLNNIREDMLERAILEKSKRCAAVLKETEVWLAFYSDFFFSEPGRFKEAFDRLKLVHPFERMHLVHPSGEVETIFHR